MSVDLNLEFENFDAFRAQADETLSWVRSLKVKGFEIPNPANMSPDQNRRYNELQLSLESLDRWPDVKNEAGEVVRLGALKDPHRRTDKDGSVELLEEYDTRLARAVLGDEYEAFVAAGGSPSDIKFAHAYMNKAAQERAAAD